MLLVSAPVGPYSCVTIVFRSIAIAIAWRTLMSERNGCLVPALPRSPSTSLVVSMNGKKICSTPATQRREEIALAAGHDVLEDGRLDLEVPGVVVLAGLEH